MLECLTNTDYTMICKVDKDLTNTIPSTLILNLKFERGFSYDQLFSKQKL